MDLGRLFDFLVWLLYFPIAFFFIDNGYPFSGMLIAAAFVLLIVSIRFRIKDGFWWFIE